MNIFIVVQRLIESRQRARANIRTFNNPNLGKHKSIVRQIEPRNPALAEYRRYSIISDKSARNGRPGLIVSAGKVFAGLGRS